MKAPLRLFSILYRFGMNCLISCLLTLLIALPSLAQDFTVRHIGDYGNVTVMEATGNYGKLSIDGSPNILPRQLIAKEFFKTHKDEYDFLTIFTNFDFDMGKDTLAFYSGVRNDVSGIGIAISDSSAWYGSNGKLQGIVDMGNIAANPSNPLDPAFQNTLGILAHEVMHRWGVYPKFKDTSGNISNALIGSEGAHWSFLLDSRGSVMYGNQWRDNGDGTFTSVAGDKYYSPLDLYLMGMIDKSKVPPMLLIENAGVNPGSMPNVGATITGSARYVTIDDIIAAEGERTPNATQAQKKFKMAFIFVSSPASLSNDDLYGIENIRNGFLTRFSILTDGQGLVQIASTPKDDMPVNPGVRPVTTAPRTLPPSVDDGVKWLLEGQQADGSWTDFTLTTERDTSEVVTTLQILASGSPQFKAGLSWLGSNASANTDYLARRIEAAVLNGADTQAMVQELVSRRNMDGGWGSGRSFISNPTDSALALKALARAGYLNQEIVGKAIDYLRASQNPDGGWSGGGSYSTIQPTAAVLTAFGSYRKSFALEQPIAKGVAFLAGKQNADGGFGNSPSTVYDSSLAIMALQEVGAEKERNNQGVAYLNGLQAADGSWEESPYQTALAVRAVWTATTDPDLAVKSEDISFIPAKVTTVPTAAVVSAVVWNLGRTDVPLAKIALYDGGITPEQKVAEQSIAFPSLSPTTVTFSVPVSDGNEHLFYVAVDPDSAIKESDKGNNNAAKLLVPEATFDFSILSADITASPVSVDFNQEMKLSAKITNHGTSHAYSVPVRFFIDESGAAFEIATVPVDLPAGATVVKEVVWKANKAGSNMTLAVQVDPANAFTELAEDNNKGVTVVSVNALTVTGPDLTCASKDIVVSPTPVNQGGSAVITATVRNEGVSLAEAVKVDFYHGVPGEGGVLIGTQNIASLAPGQAAPVSVTWADIDTAGVQVIFVKVDPAATVQELFENNNDAFTSVTVRSLPDLSLGTGSLAVSPSAPKAGDTIAVAVTVQNKGDQDIADVPVQLSEGAVAIGSQLIPVVKGKSQATVNFSYTVTSGVHQLTSTVDPEHKLVEQLADNNSATKTVVVQDANLWLSEPYISPNGDGVKDSTQFLFRLDTVSSVQVDVLSANGEIVRTFSGGELDATSGTTVTWDGLNDAGMVVKDGEYRIQVRNASGRVLGSLAITVDNNLLPWTDAIGTQYYYRKDIGCNSSFAGEGWTWLNDESGFIAIGSKRSPSGSIMSKVIYTSIDGEPSEEATGLGWDFISYSDLKNQPNGNLTSLVQYEWWRGYSLLLSEKAQPQKSFLLGYVNDIQKKWSSDGTGLAIKHTSSGRQEIFVLDATQDSPTLKSLGTSTVPITFDFSENSRLAWVRNGTQIWATDISGNTPEMIYASTRGNISVFKWVDNSRFLVSFSGHGTFIYDLGNRSETKVSDYAYPELSPDRRKIVIQTEDGADVLSLDGSLLYRYASLATAYYEVRSWSKDSRYVAVQSQEGSYNYPIVVLDTASQNEVKLPCDFLKLPVEWLNNDALVYRTRYDLIVYDMKAEKATKLQSGINYTGSGNVVAVSPRGNYLSWSDPSTMCPNISYSITASLLNLTGSLSVVSGSQNVALRGTAMDGNFGGWRLEYADVARPESWSLVVPVSDAPVVDDVFATWVPPSAGTFYVRLTVWDKAGNVVVGRQTVSWGVTSNVTNVYKSLEAFSPNGDGVKDSVEIYYKLLAPAHVDFTVYNEGNVAVRTGFAAAGSEFLSWDGRDDKGSVVPDGKYRIHVFDNDFVAVVDTTAPNVGISFGRIMPYGSNGYKIVKLSGHALDAGLKSWVIEYGEGDTPQEWHEDLRGGYSIGKKDPVTSKIIDEVINEYGGETTYKVLQQLQFLSGKKLRITAEDLAGNKSSFLAENIEKRVVLLQLNYDVPTLNRFEDLSWEVRDYLNDDEPKEIVLSGGIEPGLNRLFATETLDVQVQSRQLQYYSNGWKDAFATITVYPEMVTLDFSSIENCEAIRVRTVDVTGRIHLSNTFLIGTKKIPEGDDPSEESPVKQTIPGIITEAFEATHIEASGCNNISGKFELPGASLLVKEATSFKYVLQTVAGPIPLSTANTQSTLGNIIINTPGIPEGAYPLKAVFTLADNTTHELAATNQVFVDRTLPVSVLQPLRVQGACPLQINDPGGVWTGVEVNAVIADNLKVKRYELYYGIGDNPDAWYPAMTGTGTKSTRIAGTEPVNGKIGIWNVSNIDASRYSLKLKVIDEAGNVSCDVKSFSLDTSIEFKSLTTDATLLSPNGDGNAEAVNATFEIGEQATTELSIFKLLSGGAPDSVPARTVSAAQERSAGTGTVTWDGKNDAGAVLQDGRYAFSASAVDACGNAAKKWNVVELDTTPPAVAITYPSAASPLRPGNIIEVKGSAEDLHFKSYLLEAGAGDAPSSWVTIAAGTAPVSNGILGGWNSFGLQGRWTLRLSAEDSVGNKQVVSYPIDLNTGETLIKSLDTAPRLFSPNGDGKLETTAVGYEVSAACEVSLDILDAAGQVVTSQPAAAREAGSYSFVWDGKTTQGTPLGDALYTVRLKAVSAADPLVTQTETVTLTLEKTPPAMVISEPADSAYLNKYDVAVVGSVSDTSLKDYAVTITGPVSQAVVDAGNQSRSAYTFGLLKELPEDTYTINAQANDQGENSANLTRTFTIDRTAPKVILETPAPGEYFGAARGVVKFTGSVFEKHLAQYRLRYGAGDAPAVWQDLSVGDALPATSHLADWTVGAADGVADGTYTVSLYAVDKAGLEGEAKARVVIDNTPPTIAFSSPKDGGYLKGALDIIGTLADTNLESGTLEFSPGNCSSAFKWHALKSFTASVSSGVLDSWQALPADGDYCLRLSATDKSGNNGESKISVVIDTHPPAAPQLAGEVKEKTGALLKWTANAESDLEGYNLYRKGAKVNAQPLTVTEYHDAGLAEGPYDYVVKAVDRAGNESAASNTIKLVIDVTPPDARISSPKAGSQVSGLVDIKGTAHSNDDFKEYRVFIGHGTSPTSWTLIRRSPLGTASGLLSTWDTVGLGEGTAYTLKLEAEDISGNIAAREVAVTVDNTPPNAPVLLTAVPSGSDVTVSWNANAETDLAGYLLYRNGQLANVKGIAVGSFVPYLLQGTTYLDAGLPDGRYSYALVAADNAGNISNQSAVLETTVDVRPPHAVMVAPLANAKVESDIQIKAECPDLDVTAMQFQYRKSGDTVWIDLGAPVLQAPYLGQFDPKLLGLQYGTYQLQAKATDAGGKTDPAPVPISVIVTDITPPAVPNHLNALEKGSSIALSWDAGSEPNLGYFLYRTAEGVRTKITATSVKDVTYLDLNLADATYTYEVTAVDSYGNESVPSVPVSARVFAPTVAQPFTPVAKIPLQLAGTGAVPGSPVEILRNTATGVVAAGTATADAAGNFSAEINTLSLGQNSFSARSSDAAGNVSRASDPVVVVYGEVPAAPTGVNGTVQGYDVSLSWDQPSGTGIAGHNVYRDGAKLNLPVSLTAGEISASSYDYDDWESQTAYAMDGNPATYWSNYNEGGPFPPQWLEIALPVPQLINHVEIMWGADWRNRLLAGKDFEIQAWSGFAWIPLAKVVGNSSALSSIDLKPSYMTDRVRIQIDTADSWQVMIKEVVIKRDNLLSVTGTDLNVPDGRHTYNATAVSDLGFESDPSPIQLAVGDATPPAAPQTLTATAANADVTLNWVVIPDSEPAGYNVYRGSGQGWIKLNTSLVSATSYVDAALKNALYTYRVTALDAFGNESEPSPEASALVAVAGPPVPSNLSATALPEGGKIGTSWESTGNTSRYNIYRGTTSGGPYTKLSQIPLSLNSFVDGGAVNGIQYFYVVTGVDPSGNESGYSVEASATANDTWTQQPQIISPTVPGHPVTVTLAEATIACLADSAVKVELFQNGAPAGEALPLANDTLSTQLINHSASLGSVSDDGRLLAYTDTGNLGVWVKRLDTGETIQVSPYVARSVQWAPDNKRLAYVHYDPAYATYRLVVYDAETRMSALLTTDGRVYEEFPSWSPDGGKIVFRSSRDVASELWVRDLTNDSMTKLPQTSYAVLPRFSPDGQKISYFQRGALLVHDLASNSSTLIGTASDAYMDWSPDGSKLAYPASVNGRAGIYAYDFNLNSANLVVDAPKATWLAWSPDGKGMAFMQTQADWSVSLMLSDPKRGLIPLGQKIVGVAAMDWLPSGKISYLAQKVLTMAGLQGSFTFEKVRLERGENVFDAVAVDAAGNRSVPSESITVSFDTSHLPDLAISTGDIDLFPQYPMPGEEVLVNATVRNVSGQNIDNAVVDFYLWEGEGDLKFVESRTIPHLAANEAATVVTRVTAGGGAKTQSVIAVVDPSDSILEVIESNNYASADFIATDKDGLFAVGTLDSDKYAANADVGIGVVVHNSGLQRSGVLEVVIEDAQGNKVTSLGSRPVTLPYGAKQEYSFAWNTGAVFAGFYQVCITVKDAADAIAVSAVPFVIIPDINLGTSVSTNKAVYGPHESVTVSTSISNKGTNHVLQGVTARVSILNSQNVTLFAENRDLENMFPGIESGVASVWSTGVIPAGEYRAVVEAIIENMVISTSTTSFSLSAVPIVSGTLTVDVPTVAISNDFKASYMVSNTGNADVDGVLEASLVDPVTLAVLKTDTRPATLLKDSSQTGEFVFSAQGLELKPYKVLLEFVSSLGRKTIGTSSLVVKDATPPEVTIISPVLDGIYEASVQLSVSASDNASGTGTVEYSMDGGDWKILPLADSEKGTYSLLWQPGASDNGYHTVSFRGIDRVGNTSTPVYTTFIYQYTKDYLAPVLWMSTLSDGASTNDQVLNVAGRVWDDTAMREVLINGVSVPFDNDGAFSYPLPLTPGANVVTTVATDQSGNTTMDVRSVKLLSANLNVLTPADNSKTALGHVLVTGSADATSTVTVTLLGQEQPVTRDGEAFASDVMLAPGPNSILITAKAQDGLTATRKRTVLYDDQKPSLSITSPDQDIRTNLGSIMIKGTASDPWTAVGISLEVDGVAYAPVLANGAFEQLLTMTEERPYAITVTATNEVGAQTTAQRNVIHDVTPPELAIDPLPSQINQPNLTVTGLREAEAKVAVTCATAVVGEVIYPTPTSWSVIVSNLQLGDNEIAASSSDAAGNSASVSAHTNFIEGSPDIAITATPGVLWPPNHKMVPVILGGEVVPHGADVQFVSISVTDEYGEFFYKNLKFGDTVLLKAWRKGNDKDGRTYTVTAVVTDSAGNTTTKTTAVTVPHDQSPCPSDLTAQ